MERQKLFQHLETVLTESSRSFGANRVFTQKQRNSCEKESTRFEDSYIRVSGSKRILLTVGNRSDMLSVVKRGRRLNYGRTEGVENCTIFRSAHEIGGKGRAEAGAMHEDAKRPRALFLCSLFFFLSGCGRGKHSAARFVAPPNR